MASDDLRRIGRYIKKTRRDINTALERYHPDYPKVERSRDVVDRNNSFITTFKTKGKQSTELSLYFDTAPILSQCQQGCLHGGCKSIAVDSAGSHTINVGESYRTGTIHAFLGETQLSSFVIDETNPSAGEMEVNTPSGGQLTVCYLHDECELPCVEGVHPNCVTATGTIDTFARTVALLAGPYTPTTNVLGVSSGGFGTWRAGTETPLSGPLEFPGAIQPIETIYQTNRITPYLNASSLKITITQQVSSGHVGIKAQSDTDRFSDQSFVPFTGAVATLTTTGSASPSYLVGQNQGLIYNPNLTGSGTYEVASGSVGDTSSYIQVISGTGGSIGASDPTDYSMRLSYTTGAAWNINAGIIRFDFNLLSITGDSIYFVVGSTSVEINGSSVTLSSSSGSNTYSRIISAGVTYTCDIKLNLINSEVGTRIYPVGTTPPDWEMELGTAGEYAGGSDYHPDLYVRLRNTTGADFRATISRIHYAVSVISVNGEVPDLGVIDLTPVEGPSLVTPGNTAFFKTWDTNTGAFGTPECPAVHIFSSDTATYNQSSNPSWVAEYAGSPHVFGVSHSCHSPMNIAQQTASVVFSYTADTWGDSWYVRVRGEYQISADGVPNELAPGGSATIIGAFQTFNWGDVDGAFAFPYSVLGGDEGYVSHTLVWGQNSGWIPFEFRAGNQGSGGGLSVATGNKVTAGQMMFQWGVHILNNPFDLTESLGGTRGNGTDDPGWVGNGYTSDAGRTAMFVRDISIEIVKNDPTIITLPNCEEDC
jgi:hypothetical protein